jgi:hypothetical protein
MDTPHWLRAQALRLYHQPPINMYISWIALSSLFLVSVSAQVRLYRSYLRDESAGGLWRHIVLGANDTDSVHWSTGAYRHTTPTHKMTNVGKCRQRMGGGMWRVLRTLKSSSFSPEL